MKKIALLFLSFILLFGIFSCAIGETTTNDDPKDPAEETPKPKDTYHIAFYDGETLLKEDDLAVGAEITFPNVPNKDGMFFSGWYDEDDFEFAINLMPKGDVNLYTFYEEGFTYRFVDYDDTLIFEGHGKANSLITVPKDPERAKEGTSLYTFTGWDQEIAPLTKNITYKATYSVEEVYVVTYVLDGGNWNYYSYDDVVKDLLNDYNRFGGTSYTVATVPTGAWENANVHSFFLTEKYHAKWEWLIKYFSKNASLINRPAFLSLLSADAASDLSDSNYKYQISYEFRAFLRGDQITSNINYQTVNYQNYDLQFAIWHYYQEVVEKSLVVYVPVKQTTLLLNKVYKQNFNFNGWYDNEEFSGNALTSYKLTGDTTFYAKFTPVEPVSEIVINNEVAELEKLSTYQLEWNVYPDSVKDKRVKFKSSNGQILSISNSGLITIYKEGDVTITVTSALTPSVVAQFNVHVYAPSHFNVEYVTSSIVSVGESVEINAEYITRDGEIESLQYASSDSSIISVNNNVAAGLAKGYANVILTANDGNTMEIGITVTDGTESEVAKLVLAAHNSNILKVYNLGIGDGIPAYYMDMISSISKLMFNEEYTVDTKYYSVQQGVSSNHGKEKTSTEFITVHYTGNMSATADGNANANYFATGGNGTSIHYVTGNDGIYYILDEKLVGFHAGDGTGTKFEWIPTGVMVKGTDPTEPVISINEDSMYTINGTVTSIPVPTGSTALTKKVTDAKWINDMGLAYKIVDGEYYMGTTWWCYSQVAEGRICNHGGNNNSIGIESCVNKGSDIWYTWHKTAQLVADLMNRYHLDITRVVGHHFFTAKDCPQPMLENQLQLWYEFIEMVKAEYELLTKFSADYTLSMEVLSDSKEVKTTGRVSQPKFNDCIKYQVTITNKATGEKELITLSSLITGQLDKDR